MNFFRSCTLLLVPLLLLAASDPAHAQAGVQRWSLEPELRIGSIDTPPDLLTEVGDLAVAAGRVFVAQPQDRQVRVFDTAGRFIGVIGRDGAGPGEFRSFASIGVRSDTLWVVDRFNARVTVMDLKGVVLDARQVQGPVVPGAGRPLAPTAVLSGGSFLATARVQGGVSGARSADAEFVQQIDTSGAVTGKFGEHDLAGSLGRVVIGTRALHFTHPLRTPGLTAWSSDGSLVALLSQRAPASGAADSFQITLFRSPRDTVYSRWYRFDPVPVTGEVRDSIRAEQLETFSALGFNRLLARRVIEDSIPLPAFQPPVRHLVTSSDGRVLVGREAAGQAERSWLVLNRRGDFVAHFWAPAGLEVRELVDTRVWGTVCDELDVPYVVRYRLVRASPASAGYAPQRDPNCRAGPWG